jgi:membrane protease YdiL (CAAX protease family)
MTSAKGRLRSLSWFALAAIYYVFAQQVSLRAANGLSSGDWFPLVSNLLLLFLLCIGYTGMGYAAQHQSDPLREMGLVRREGWQREFALGAALGWAGVVACVLPVAIFGSLVITFWKGSHQYLLLFVHVATLAVMSLAQEIAFRGYPFQRLIESIGPALATMLMPLLYVAVHLTNTDATAASVVVAVLFGWVLSLAYLRTRALWLAWGLHFAWNACLALLFGLPIEGTSQFSPVISSNTIGPAWLTGGDRGPEGSAIAILVMFLLMIALMKVTRDYAHRYAQPVIIPGGIPVDIDAIARRQHEAPMGVHEAQSRQQLVQIAPTSSSGNGTAANSQSGPVKQETLDGLEQKTEFPS